jgi:hypothetical protein
MHKRALIVSAIVGILSFVSAQSGAGRRAAPIPPTLDLGTFGSRGAIPTAINNRGDIVGVASEEQGFVGFLWTRQAGFQQLAAEATPVDINDRGQIVGQLVTCNPDDTCRTSGFLWSTREGFLDLGRFIPAAINERGDIAGFCVDALRACVWRRGALRPIAAPLSFAFGINDRGDVVGGSFDADGAPLDAFIVRGNGRVVNLGTGRPDDINNHGVVSGWMPGIENSSAAMWVDGVFMLLAGEPSITSGVNASGWVLVNREGFASARNARTGAVIELAPQGAAEAADINDRGEIVGTADLGTGRSHIVIWRLRGARNAG